MLPPDRVLFLGLKFSGIALEQVRARRDAITAENSNKKGDGKGKANNVRFYVHSNGLYLIQEEFDSLLELPANAGEPIRPEAAFYADVDHEADLDFVEAAFVRYLGQLFGDTPFVQLGQGGVTLVGNPINPAGITLDELARRIEALGGRFDRQLLERYHIALNHLSHKHFVILTGISGTGKTLLAKTYAYAVLGVAAMNLTAENFYLIPVRPDWTEPSHFLGFMDAVSGDFQRTRFTDALLQAHRQPARPVFICLDEMNLAQPEHYFADVLSSMEAGSEIRLHSGGLDASVPGSIPWPENLFITGTVNMDETTRPLSSKVLDRANVLDMSAVDVRGFCMSLHRRDPALRPVLESDMVDRLEALASILAPHGLHFGNRVIEEIARYLTFSRTHGLLADALDLQIEQKILTKLRGGPEHREMLDKLVKELTDMKASHTTVERMRVELGLYESFQYWR